MKGKLDEVLPTSTTMPFLEKNGNLRLARLMETPTDQLQATEMRCFSKVQTFSATPQIDQICETLKSSKMKKIAKIFTYAGLNL